MTQNLLEVRDLCVDFRLHAQGKIRAVRGVSFRVRPGSTVALVGESGSGKSVISQAIMGVLPGSAELSGQILFNDPNGIAGGSAQPLDIVSLDPEGARMRAVRGGRISMIFQEPMTSLSPLHTVGDQISEAVLLHRDADRATALDLTREMLARVGFPEPGKAVHTYPFELSGGLRQRAMIAMALVCRPALLIADEPTTALDVTIQAQILQLLQNLQKELQMAVLLITHDLGVVANMAEEVVVVYHGEVMESGTLDDIYLDPRHPYLRALMRAVPRVGMRAGERLTPLREVEPTDSGHLRAHRPPAQPGQGDGVLLEVRAISKRFVTRRSGWFGSDVNAEDGVQALDNVSFDIRRGECLGLVGESGCGKTTVSKVILRVLNPDAGSVRYDDGTGLRSLLDLDDQALAAMRCKIQYIFQDPVSSLNPRMTVFDIISEPLIIHGQRNADARATIIKALMQQVGLDPRFLSRYPHSFSGGQRQRIGIARALALNPELIICDEPVSALDVSVQAQVLNLLKDLQKSLGLTYLFISHNLAVVDYMADRIAVMCAGYLVEVAPREVLFRNPVHPYTKALLAAVPRPDPARKLDLSALMEGKVSHPSAWSPPFGVTDDERPGLVGLGDGHFVRAAASLLSGD